MTTDYERDIQHIRQLYFKGFYDLLDISRIKKLHPDELINIMMDNSISLRKRDLGGYSAYKLFNDIDRRLQQIEQKLNNRDNDLCEEDLMFEEYNSFDEYYPHIYNILFDDEDDDDENDYIEYEEDQEEKDENADAEEEKIENVKIEEEKQGEQEENIVEIQTPKNNWGLTSLLKNPIVENIFLGAFGEAMFFSAVLCNATIIFFSVLHLFHDYCKN